MACEDDFAGAIVELREAIHECRTMTAAAERQFQELMAERQALVEIASEARDVRTLERLATRLQRPSRAGLH
jgi:hypothetical protein